MIDRLFFSALLASLAALAVLSFSGWPGSPSNNARPQAAPAPTVATVAAPPVIQLERVVITLPRSERMAAASAAAPATGTP